jgi:uncharacterized membrane protein
MTASVLESPAPPRTAAASAASGARFDAPDLLRGIIMVVMLLDHTRDFTHATALKFDPTDLTQTNVALFFTRWITHYCAPLFVFLAGMAVAFQAQRGKSPQELSVFLLKRGFWLVFLELVVFRVLIFWNVAPTFFFVQVIWALGISMICLAALMRAPRFVVLIVGVGLVVLHNAFDGVQVAPWTGPDSPVPSALEKLWMVLHQPGPFPIVGWPSPVLMVMYPAAPWIGVMALGWLLGDVYRREPPQRQRALLRLGVALTAAFVLLRAANVYGDLHPWSAQSSPVFTALSFLNTTKYPPSLLFLLMTVGPGLIALSYFDRTGNAPRGPLARALIVYGRVPLFFYLLQWIFAKAAGYTLGLMFSRDVSAFTQFPFEWQWNERFGFSLWVTWLVWIAGAFALYRPCRWFASVKARRRDWWLSYI